MTERKFASGLRPGIKAAQLRESVSEVVRQTTTLVSVFSLRNIIKHGLLIVWGV
jgi:hypothetical protein